MSDQIKHECGIAFVRLLKPLAFYQEKYGTPFYGLLKLQQMMLKQRNRGQDGVGVATIKLNPEPGHRFISRKRSNSKQALTEVFDGIFGHFNDLPADQLHDAQWLKNNKPYIGELLLGHLRYGTHGQNTIERVHPFHRQSNWINRNLIMAGNFNLTNVSELFNELVTLGQFPKEQSDTVTILEKIGHFLDDEIQRLHTWYKPDGHNNQEINDLIRNNLDVARILRRATKKFDGGYVLGGLIGHGDAFVLRDPNGIRPGYYYADDEVVVAASERPAIQTTFDITYDKVQEIKAGHALIVRANGEWMQSEIRMPAAQLKQCSFERIYFSRGNDREIYQERKALGKALVETTLKAIDYDFEHTVFSFIPNTSESAFYGFAEGLHEALNKSKLAKLTDAENPLTDPQEIARVMQLQPRIEKLVLKDEKNRTFIADAASRNAMMGHAYDVTYGLITNDVDTLVLMDDSIVRGTTLRDSIVSICSRLRPKRIIILSSAPQIRYPDCYGIDMSKMKDFVAFQALIDLLHDTGRDELLEKAYHRAKNSLDLPVEAAQNEVKPLYDLFTDEEISKRISEIVTPLNIKPEIQVIFQSIDDLHIACPKHLGDWYFSGNYPTAGGNQVVNRAFVHYMHKSEERAY
jgi:amidophosphoribosyltransferase